MPNTESGLGGAGLVRLESGSERRRPLTLCCPTGDYQCVATTESSLLAPGALFDLSSHNIRDVDTDAGLGGLLKSCQP